MGVSVVDPISPAFARMARVTFKPFDIGKWFGLGFCAWLALLGEGGGPNFNGNGFGRSSGSGPSGSGSTGPDPVWAWITGHLPLVICLGVLLFVLVMAIGLVFMWLKCRGRFMFLDGIINNRGLVVQPWREFRTQANSLFWFYFWLMWIGLGGAVIVLGIPLLIAWPDIAARSFGGHAVSAIILAVVLYIPFALVFGVIHACTNQFVVPLMWLRRQGVLAAWAEFRRVIVPGNFWSIVLYLLMLMLLSLAGALTACVAGCLACCVGCIPYLGTVLTLPVHVFLRCYGVYYLEQFGGDYKFFPEDPAEPRGFPVIMDGGPAT